MFSWRALVYALFVLSILDIKPILGKRSSSHSYPKSGGLSGGGSHSYPRSGGLSGGGAGHGYPSSGGMSGGGSHGYPSSGGMSGGGSHGYPSTGGMSGGGSHGYPSSGGMSGGSKAPSYPSNGGYPSSSNNHGYPSSSNNHGYPGSGGLSGSNNRYPSGSTHNTHTTIVHHNYHYSPPQQIRYTPVGGGVPMTYPVYRGTPPTYVYQYKDSGSKYGTLLAGLALLNLGTLAGAAYASSHRGPGGSSSYKAQPGEICKFAIKKDNGDYEETKIDCQLISSFIYQEQAKTQSPTNTNTTITTTTVTNVTVVNNTGVSPSAPEVTPQLGDVIYKMLANGTLIPLNATNANNTVSAPAVQAPNNTITSMTVTTTTTNTTVVDALSVKGKAIEVTPKMQCFVIRLSPTGNMRKTVPCGLLQSYAEQSLKKNSAVRNVPVLTVLAVVMTACLVY